MSTSYVNILIPYPLRGAFTYTLPSEFANSVQVGSRVVVQFGSRHYYTGIVVELSEQNPQPQLTLKPVVDVADPQPIVLPQQIDLWRWMCNYYMCSPGEVMKAALPSGLKPESDTVLMRNADFDEDNCTLSPREQQIWQILKPDRGVKLQDLAKETGIPNLINPVKKLLEAGAIQIYESLQQRFKPRTELCVKLTDDYTDMQKLHALFDCLKRSKAQEALLLKYMDMAEAKAAATLNCVELLKEVTRHDLCSTPGEIAALNALRKKGILKQFARERPRLGMPCTHNSTDFIPVPRKQLAEKQQQAHNRIQEIFKQKQVCLLHGVTSSGKTEVYMALIEEMIAQGKQVLYLVPEIALTTQLTTRLARVFGYHMGVYHSKYPDSERVELWKHQISDQPFPLILGVRSALFLPFKNLGLIIIDEEHETSYKQQDPAPRYHARDTAIVLAHQCGAKVLLGTATPSIESYHNAQTDKYGLVEMPDRYGGVQMPEIILEDVKELKRKKMMTSVFSPRLTNEVQSALEHEGQAILFQNRRGFSPVLECRTCGWTPRCTRCDVSLTYHRQMNRMVCHYCGTSYEVPRQCPNCADTEMRDLGYGTEKIETEAQKVFPTARTERMDLDTTRSRSAYEDIIRRFESGQTNLLIGTQMVTKGLDFDRVKVVGILHADQLLNIPDFRAHERAFQMLSQVAGRAGRRGQRGLVVMQTRQADSPLLQQVIQGDYQAMFRDQYEEREAFGFPPACRLIDIYLKHRNEQVVIYAAEALSKMLKPHFEQHLAGPDRPVVSRIQGLHIRKLMLKVSPQLNPTSVRRTLWAASDILLKHPGCKGTSLFFDVDP